MATKVKPTIVKIFEKYIRMRNSFLYKFIFQKNDSSNLSSSFPICIYVYYTVYSIHITTYFYYMQITMIYNIYLKYRAHVLWISKY